MGKQKQAKKSRVRFAQKKTLLSMHDQRLPAGVRMPSKKEKKMAGELARVAGKHAALNKAKASLVMGKDTGEQGPDFLLREVEQNPASMYLHYNAALGPPFHVLLDTNFINFAIRNKIDLIQGMTDCLFAKAIPYLTDCVLAELEKMGSKYRVALKIAKDPRIQRLSCMHRGTYADDCLLQRATQHKCYIIATCDKDLRRRIRRVPGVPTMYIKAHRFTVDRLPDAFGAPKNG